MTGKKAKQDDELRRRADELEERIKLGRPARHNARCYTVGRLITSGRLEGVVSMKFLEAVRVRLQGEKNEKSRDNLARLDPDVMAEQGYSELDGMLVAPRSYPQGAPPRFGGSGLPRMGRDGVLQVGGGASPPVIQMSPAEGQHEIRVDRKYAAWSDGLREHAQWVSDQECRARVFGGLCSFWALGDAEMRKRIRDAVEQDGDAGELVMWQEAELRVDYSAAELGGVA